MSDVEEWILSQLQEVRKLIAQGQASELNSDTASAMNSYSSVINILAAIVDRMKEPPFAAPESIDQLSNIALFIGGRIRLLGITARDPSAGIANLVKQDASTVLKDIRDTFEKIKTRIADDEDSGEDGGFGEYQSYETLTGFDQLFGNEDVVKQLKSFKRAPVKKATLMYGPPGSGKTSFAKALAKEMKLNFRLVDVSQLLSSYQGQTEKNISTLFRQINEHENELVLLDEAETLIQNRSSGASITSGATIVAVFLVQLERMKNPARLVMTTNYANRVDPAIMRRLNAIFIPYPQAGDAAYEVFYRILHSYFLYEFSAEDWQSLRQAFVEKTNGVPYSPADFTTAIDNQVLKQFESDPLLVRCGISRGSASNKISQARNGSFCMIDEVNGVAATDNDSIIPHPFTREDVLEIIHNMQPSITAEQYLAYQER